MTEQITGEDRKKIQTDSLEEEAYSGPGLTDGIRFLYLNRLKLTGRFLIFFGLGLAAIAYLRYSAPTVVQGTLSLMFRGIDRYEYPSGKKFSVEDFRSPDLLSKALTDSGIEPSKLELKRFAGQVMVIPVIPPEIQSRWKKAERDGTKKEEYLPNQFDISFQVGRLKSMQLIRLFDALTDNYRRRVKYEQEAALKFVSVNEFSYEKMASLYDFWDIPELFRTSSRMLGLQLEELIDESQKNSETRYQLAFRKIADDLSNWQITRLQSLQAVTYEGRLVKNRDVMLQRVRYQLSDMTIRHRQKSQEASEAERLLAIISKPSPLAAGQIVTRDGLSLFDVSALDKLIKSDYIGPAVARLSKLQAEAQVLEAEKAGLERQLALLPAATDVTLEQLPPSYKKVIEQLSSEIKDIVKNYDNLLDEYLTATVTSRVSVTQAPIVTAGEGYPFTTLLVLSIALSFFLALALLGMEHLFRKALSSLKTSN